MDTAEHSQQQKNEPDPDTIKMFVGQIPRTYTEEDCMKIFREYGPIHQLNVHRDKVTGESKGCCFVTFYHRQDALKAQGALHNTRVLPGMHNTMQVKPADLENRNERKLFVGMLNRNVNEDEVRRLFDAYGAIEEVTVLRENGVSKGCAFVTFVHRSCAHQAIKQMHQSLTFEGCSKPMVVKLADTTKDKESRKGATSGNGSGSAEQLLKQLMQPPVGNVTNQLASLGAILQNPGVASLLRAVIANLGTASAQQSQTAISSEAARPRGFGLAAAQSPSAQDVNASDFPGPLLLQQQQQQQQQQLQAIQQQQYIDFLRQQQQAAVSAVSQSQAVSQALDLSATNAAAASLFLGSAYPGLIPATSAGAALLGLGPGAAVTHAAPQQQVMDPTGALGLGLTQRQILSTGVVDPSATPSHSAINANTNKGPEGCNLFIYHLPQEFGDEDLRSLFVHFGRILSAKVYIDKQTNLSKCFGFVSFESPLSAEQAINAMNGFQIGNKRLKVQHKRASDRPYSRPQGTTPNAKSSSSGSSVSGGYKPENLTV